MKKILFIKANVLLSIVAAFFLITQVAAQYENYAGAADPRGNKATLEKPIQDFSHKYLPPSGREGGETVATAIPIASLPFNDTGNTCDNVNDYDAACPYTGSTSPDVVYSFVPPENMIIDIDLCNSGYDTKVYVYENGVGNVVGCNDDYYFSAPCYVFSSAIFNLFLTGGNTYYIVIDGYDGDCGDYTLAVSGLIPPECSTCLPCSIPEGEGDIADGGVDNFNGGCNTPPIYPVSPIQLNQVICGRSNTYLGPQGGNYRDTDWYEITLNEAGTLYWSGFAMFSLQLYIFDADCDNPYTYASGSGGDCSVVTISAALPAGTYYLWAGPTFFTGMPVGQNYNVIATLNAPPPANFCDAVVPVPVSNWALFIGIGLILVFAIVRFRKMV